MADLTAYPIIFSSEMIRALLDGRKTMTRRLAWGKPVGITSDRILEYGERGYLVSEPQDDDDGPEHWAYPSSVWQKRHDKFRAGERPWLWCRETWALLDRLTHNDPGASALADGCFYRADDGTVAGEITRWTPSIHMPKRASRLSLRVTDMRMERLQSISEEDAIAEGIATKEGGWISYEEDAVTCVFPRDSFKSLWESIHGKDTWYANPAVVVTEFEVHQQNIGSVT